MISNKIWPLDDTNWKNSMRKYGKLLYNKMQQFNLKCNRCATQLDSGIIVLMYYNVYMADRPLIASYSRWCPIFDE